MRTYFKHHRHCDIKLWDYNVIIIYKYKHKIKHEEKKCTSLELITLLNNYILKFIRLKNFYINHI